MSAFGNRVAATSWPVLAKYHGAADTVAHRVNRDDLPGASVAGILTEERIEPGDGEKTAQQRVTRAFIASTDPNEPAGYIRSPAPNQLIIVNAGTDNTLSYVVESVQLLPGKRVQLNLQRTVTTARYGRENVRRRL